MAQSGRDHALLELGDRRSFYLTDAFRRLHRDPELRRRLANAALEVAARRSWHVVTKRIVDWMESRIDAARDAEPAGVAS